MIFLRLREHWRARIYNLHVHFFFNNDGLYLHSPEGNPPGILFFITSLQELPLIIHIQWVKVLTYHYPIRMTLYKYICQLYRRNSQFFHSLFIKIFQIHTLTKWEKWCPHLSINILIEMCIKHEKVINQDQSTNRGETIFK